MSSQHTMEITLNMHKPRFVSLVKELEARLRPMTDAFFECTLEDVKDLRAKFEEARDALTRSQVSFFESRLQLLQTHIRERDEREKIENLIQSDSKIAEFVRLVHDKHPKVQFDGENFEDECNKVYLLDKNKIDWYERPSQVVGDFLDIQEFASSLCDIRMQLM